MHTHTHTHKERGEVCIAGRIINKLLAVYMHGNRNYRNVESENWCKVVFI